MTLKPNCSAKGRGVGDGKNNGHSANNRIPVILSPLFCHSAPGAVEAAEVVEELVFFTVTLEEDAFPLPEDFALEELALDVLALEELLALEAELALDELLALELVREDEAEDWA